jgi:hypothetical protein
MKNILTKILQDETSYNKSATKMLKRTHPELWSEILDITSFLPDDAKPKQRIWHLMNDTYSIPKCPISGFEVKWVEYRYLETYNASARTTLLNLRGKLNNQSENAKKKRNKTKHDLIKSGMYTPFKMDAEKIKLRTQKIEESCLKKYGVKSTLLLADVRKIQYKTKVEKGQITPIELRSSRDIYYAAVKRLTKDSWNTNFDKINPERLKRSAYNLDHIYSIQEGFRNGIPPYIISHWTNLRMLEPILNSSKGMRCDKTIDKLFEDVFNQY